MEISPAEYLELIQLAEDAAGLQAMNAIAIVFAYLTAIYIIGEKLTRFQAIALNCIYTVFYFFPVRAMVGNITREYRVGEDFVRVYSEEASTLINVSSLGEEFFVYGGSLVFLLAWLLSIAYFVETRKGK